MSENDNLPVVIQPASVLDLTLPEPSQFVQKKTADEIKNAVKKHGAFTSDGEVLVNAKAVPTLLQTDTPGANLFIADLPADQVIENGKDIMVKTAPLNQEISRRIQEPRDASKLESLKYSEKCLNTLRDNPQLEKARLVLESNNRRELPSAKKKARAGSTHCISGPPLQSGAPVHHIERVADQPRKSIDPKNLLPINPVPHQEIHKAEAHSPDALNKFAAEKGWPGRVGQHQAAPTTEPTIPGEPPKKPAEGGD